MAKAASIYVDLVANTARYRSEIVGAARTTTRELGVIRRESAVTAQSLRQMNQVAAGFIGFQAFRSGISALIDAQKSIQQIHFGLQAATGSAEGAERAYAFVAQTAKQLGLDLQSSAEGFTKLSAAAAANGVAMGQQQQLFTAFAKASTVMHLSTEKSNSALLAMEQMFSKGKIQAQELRIQLGQAIPGVAPRFQKAVLEMTKGTDLAGQSFDQLLQGGKLVTAQFLPALIHALEETGSSWEDASHSLTAELNRLSSAWFKLKTEASSGLFSDVATTSVRLMAENLNTLAGAATVAFGILGARLAGQGITAGAASLHGIAAGIAARQAEAAATVQATAALVAKTRAELIDAEATAARARAAYGGSIAADLAATAATKAHTVALKEHAAAQAALTASKAGLGARVGAGALGLVGGVPGAVILGLGALAIAIANTAREARDRQAQMEAYRKTLENIGITAQVAAEDLNRGGSIREAAQQFRDLAIALQEPQKELEDLQRRYEAMLEAQRSGGGGHVGLGIHGDTIAALREQIEALQAKMRPTQAQFDALSDQLRAKLGPAFDQVRESVLKMTDVEYGKWLRAQTPDVQDAIAQLDKLRKAAEDQRDSIEKAIAALPGKIERVGKSAREVARLDVRDWIQAEILAGNVAADNAEAMQKLIDQGALYIRLKTQEAKKEKDAAEAKRQHDVAMRHQAKGYDSLIERIKKQIEQDKERLLYTDRMTQAERLAARTRADADYKSAADEQKAFVDGLLEEAIRAGRAAKALDEHNQAVRELIALNDRLSSEVFEQTGRNMLDVLGVGVGGDALERARRMVDEQLRYQREVADIRRQFSDREMTEQLVQDMQDQLDIARSYHEQLVNEEQQYQQRLAEARGDWRNGMNKALDDYLAKASDVAGASETLFANAFQGAEDAFVKFVETGKLSFSSLVDQIIADLARLAYRQAFSQLLDLIPSAASGSGASFLSWMKGGYAAGGYTGPGAKHEPAGVVHRGEVVWSQQDISRAGGVAVVEAMRRGLRGYADGGVVGPVIPVGGSAQGVTVNVYGASSQPEVRTRKGPNGFEIDMFFKGAEQFIAGNIAQGSSPVLRQIKARTGLKDMV